MLFDLFSKAVMSGGFSLVVEKAPYFDLSCVTVVFLTELSATDRQESLTGQELRLTLQSISLLCFTPMYTHNAD